MLSIPRIRSTHIKGILKKTEQKNSRKTRAAAVASNAPVNSKRQWR